MYMLLYVAYYTQVTLNPNAIRNKQITSTNIP